MDRGRAKDALLCMEVAVEKPRGEQGMTAEVCVMNKLAVAMAADSAVTLSGRGDKIYTSVDKLFHLSTNAPVGFMVYGGASFLGIHWEVIVKQFRKEQDGKVYDHLKQYADAFLKFLLNENLFPQELRHRHIEALLHNHFIVIRSRIKDRLDRVAEENDGLEVDEYTPFIVEELKAALEKVKSYDVIKGFNKTFIAKVKKEYKETIAEIRDEVFGKLVLGADGERTLKQIAIEILTREFIVLFDSGIVFAGFGEKDYMPRLLSFKIECMLGNKLRIATEHENDVTHENSACVVPFAQQEMVHTFMRGADPKLIDFMRNTTNKTLKGALKEIGEVINTSNPRLAKKVNPIIEKAAEELLGEMFSSWEERQRDYWMPVIDIVNALPKDELASMAEALVNLTKFRRRVSTDRETVGGPIDVVVITKGDGFIWVNRKHYFEPDLNPRAMANYCTGK